MNNASIADANPGNWVTRYLPEAAQPFAQLMRLDRPIGWWLLVIPCWWGQGLAHVASGTSINWFYALLFLVGAVVMRGAGCVINDILDRRIDAQVERTRNRPIASGRVSVSAALVFLVVLLMIGLAVLTQFNWFTIMLGFLIVPVVAIYPLMKRITYYPQIVLGIAFNWGAVIGWTAVQGVLAPAPWFLYAGAIFWTLGYDTIYAHQDKDDDAVVGVYSTALKFGDVTPVLLLVVYGFTLALAGLAFWMSGGAWAFLGLGMAFFHGAWQIARFDADDPKLCLKLFKSNRTFGLLVLSGLVLDILLT
jgi:4-hydroxybenzoate polyprenyltransferase